MYSKIKIAQDLEKKDVMKTIIIRIGETIQLKEKSKNEISLLLPSPFCYHFLEDASTDSVVVEANCFLLK